MLAGRAIRGEGFNMVDRSHTEAFDAQSADRSVQFPPLPGWLADRLLRAGEKITWVYGPNFNPSWERYVTNPALFLFALALGAAWVVVGYLIAGTQSELLVLPVLAAGGLAFGSIFVLAISSGYFTRLVVTDCRLVILQGREVVRGWNLDDLPPSLLRYRMREGENVSRTVDLDALKTMLGASSDKFAESKTILAFSKQLDRIRTRDNGRP
jgi:hypothetical protein